MLPLALNASVCSRARRLCSPLTACRWGAPRGALRYSLKSLKRVIFARRQSAVIKVPLPSTQTLTYIIQKPNNETAELMLANVRASENYRRTFEP